MSHYTHYISSCVDKTLKNHTTLVHHDCKTISPAGRVRDLMLEVKENCTTESSSTLPGQAVNMSVSLMLCGILSLLAMMHGVNTLRLVKYSPGTQGKDIWPKFIYRVVEFNRKPFVSICIFVENVLLIVNIQFRHLSAAALVRKMGLIAQDLLRELHLATWATHQGLRQSFQPLRIRLHRFILTKVSKIHLTPVKNDNFKSFSPTKGYIDTLTGALPVETVTYTNWTSYIHKSTPINSNDKTSRTSVDTCAFVDPVEFNSCDLVYSDGSNCHYGSYSYDSGDLVLNGTSWTLNYKPGYCENKCFS